ncbi:MAG: hypothetical protein ACRD5H_09905 [Nitrososphaerales archaeon]
MKGTKLYAIVTAAFIAGAFLASPELRAYAVATITSADIVNETIKSEDIKNGEVKAADIGTGAVGESEIATNSVGAGELKGVIKLIFTECTFTNSFVVPSGGTTSGGCDVQGAAVGNNVIVTQNDLTSCFAVTWARVGLEGSINIVLRNTCSSERSLGTASFSIIVYET